MHPWYIQHLHVNSGLSPLQNNLYRIEVHMHWDHFVFLEKSGMSALPFKIHPYRILGCKLHTCDPKPRWNMLPWLGTRGVVPCIRYMFDGFFKGFFLDSIAFEMDWHWMKTLRVSHWMLLFFIYLSAIKKSLALDIQKIWQAMKVVSLQVVFSPDLTSTYILDRIVRTSLFLRMPINIDAFYKMPGNRSKKVKR